LIYIGAEGLLKATLISESLIKASFNKAIFDASIRVLKSWIAK
jgi:hypothetical protein